ncbi:MAG: hypothetical protein ACE5I7_09975, partial [Candidatus Binatia bacterium]
TSSPTNMPTPADPDLSLTITAAPDPVSVGNLVLYMLDVTNAGPSAVTGVTLSYPTPEDALRVQGGQAGKKALACAIRAQVHSRPGTFITYVARYKNGTKNNALTLSLQSSDLEILRVKPAAIQRDGQTFTWQNLARTAGLVKVKTRVSALVPDGTILRSSATVADGLGNVATCDHVSVVRRKKRISVKLKAQSKSKPGNFLTFVPRYSNVVGDNVMTLTLPAGVTVLSVFPPATSSNAGKLTWQNLHMPSGLVKVKTQVGSDVAAGTQLTASATLTDATGGIVGAQHTTLVRARGTAAPTNPTGLTLTAQRSVRPDSFLTYTARYRSPAPGAGLLLALPDVVVSNSVQPAPSSTSSDGLTWQTLPSASGSVKVNARVAAAVPQGTVLHASATLTSAGGEVLRASRDTVVSAAISPGGSSPAAATLFLNAPRTVRRGLTTTITVSYRKLAGTGTVQLTLPPELTVQLTVPAATVGADGQVSWSGLRGPNGSVKARVLVASTAPAGSVLASEALLTAGNDSQTSAAAQITVRE